MSSDPSRPANRGWRQNVPTPPRESSNAKRDWQKEAPTTPGGRRFSRATKFKLTALAFFICCALVVLVIYWIWPPKPAALVLVGADYEDNAAVAPNVYGWDGLDQLHGWARENGDKFAWWGSGIPHAHFDTPFKLTKKNNAWDEGLDDIKEKTVVVFLALHGGADSDGPYLLPSDADPGDRKSRLRVKDVINRLKSEKLKKKHLVLLIDATQVPDNAFGDQGMLHNDFARQLKAFNNDIKDAGNLIVICASDEDQRSWYSEEWRRTIFAHWVFEGIRGGAARNGDKAISALDLYDFVAAHVKSWVRANRDADQTPLLLPASDDGKNLAREIKLAVAQDDYKPADPAAAPGASFNAPQDLVKAWEHCQALSTQPTPPWIYSPQLWRQYLDTLLRYEWLVRAGANQQAESQKKRLRSLEERMEQARSLPLDSLQNSLPEATALGLTAPGMDGLGDRFDQLWKSNPADRVTQWQALKQEVATTPLADRLLRIQFAAYLFDRVTKDPARLNDAAALMALRDDDSSLRPAEVNFLYMYSWLYQNKLPQATKQPPADLLLLALRVRRSAELTAWGIPSSTEPAATGYAYPEQVYRWVAKDLQKADDERSKGQDLLFAADETSWQKARTHLEEAQKLYDAIQKDAALIRRACATRDEVLAALPYYSAWLARRRVRTDDQVATVEAQVVAVEQIWADLHALVEALETTSTAPARLKSLTDEVRASTKHLGFDELRKNFDALCEELRDVEVQQRHHEIEEVLVVPLIKPDLRVSLLRNLRKISGKLNVSTAAGQPENAAGSGSTPDRVRRNAQWHWRLAVAMLGRRLLNDKTILPGADYNTLTSQISGFDSDDSWWKTLAQAGDALGADWQRLPGKIDELAQNSRKVALNQAEENLVTADRLARLVDGADAAAISQEPTRDCYRLWMYHFLLGQARRTWADNWFNERGQEYYRLTATLFLSDAEQLVSGRTGELSAEDLAGRLKDATTLRQLLAIKTFEATGQPDLFWTSTDPQQVLKYHWQAPAVLPPGYPVCFAKIDKPLEADSLKPGTRQVVTLQKASGGEWTADMPLTLRLPGDEDRQPAMVLTTMYRGRILPVSTRIDLERTPTLVVKTHPMPYAAGLTILTDTNVTQGAVAFLFDCSGSMKEVRQGSTKRKWDEAVDALRTVLKELPSGTYVSLRLLGYKNNEHKRVWDSKPWKPEYLTDFLAKIEPPEGGTPAASAIVAAVNEDFPTSFKGFKTVVVLTDGVDEERDKIQIVKIEGKERLRSTNAAAVVNYLKEGLKNNSDVFINMILFGANEDEDAISKQQFGILEKLKPPGTRISVKAGETLLDPLREAMRPKFRILDAFGKPVPNMPAEGLSASLRGEDTGGTWSPRLDPDKAYQVWTHNVFQDIRLKPGDYLLLDVKQGNEGIVFRRGLFREQKNNVGRPWQADANKIWAAAALQNRLDRDQKSLELQLSLENFKEAVYQRETSVLQQAWPDQVWIEVQAQGRAEQPTLRVGNLVGYPAPMWYVSAPPWLTSKSTSSNVLLDPAPATVRMFWGGEPLNGQIPITCRLKESHSEPVIDGDKISLDVKLEPRTVEVQPGVFRKDEQCLVVRVVHAPGKPIMVLHPEQDRQHGAEHYFFDKADKPSHYTAVFWPVDAEKLKDNPISLKLLSLNQFKAAARANGAFVELKLDPPTVEDRGPRQVPSRLLQNAE